MISLLRRNVSWLILAAGTVGLPYFSLSEKEVNWTEMASPYSTIDMGGTVGGSVDPVIAGSGSGNLTYTVTATNFGPDAADDASAAFSWDNKPAEATVYSIAVSAGTWDNTGPQINWEIGPLGVGQSATMTIVITVGENVPATEELAYSCFFYSEAWSNGGDPNPGNDNTSGTTGIAGVIRVDRDAAPGGNGTSWFAAFDSLAVPLDVADQGDELWVAEGVYRPDAGPYADNDPLSTYQLKNGVAVYGGFDGTETAVHQRRPRGNLTVLSGDIDSNDVVDADGITRSWEDLAGVNAYHLVTATGTDTSAVLDGFVLTGGWAAGTGSLSGGAAVSCAGASPALTTLAVIGNRSGDQAVLHGCTSTISNSVFDSNYAHNMAAISNRGGTYVNCVFSNNTTAAGSGSVFAIFGGSLSLRNCRLVGNSATTSGAVVASDSTINLTNVLLSGNEADTGAALEFGGTTNATLTNVTVSGNRCFNASGAVHITSAGVIEIGNSVFWNNSAVQGAGVLSASIYNPGTGSVTVSSSLLQGSGGSGAWTGGSLLDGGGNLDGDPLFLYPVDSTMAPTTLGNYRLALGSPAMDSGDNALNTLPYDLDGNLRVLDATIDMGAFEGHMIFGDWFETGDTTVWTNAVP